MKPVLKAPGSMLLKLRCDETLSNFGFNLNLRRYMMAYLRAARQLTPELGEEVQVDPIKPMLKAPENQTLETKI